jgi:hypothetical protein
VPVQRLDGSRDPYIGYVVATEPTLSK